MSEWNEGEDASGEKGSKGIGRKRMDGGGEGVRGVTAHLSCK